MLFICCDSYCYGGSAAIRLGATDQVHSLVIAHPGGFTIPQVKALKVHFRFSNAYKGLIMPHRFQQLGSVQKVCTQISRDAKNKKKNSGLNIADDMSVSDALRMQAEAVFAERKNTSQFIDYEFKVYKGGS